jgi:hypothetical protein
MSADNGSLLLMIQTTTIVVSLVSLVSTLLWNRVITRRKTTIDFMLADQNKAVLELRAEFLEAVKQRSLEELADKDAWFFNRKSFALVSWMNRYEVIAIGIDERTIDERIFKTFWRSTLVRDWIRCAPAILKQRQQLRNPRIFIEWERLATKWAIASELDEIWASLKAHKL